MRPVPSLRHCIAKPLFLVIPHLLGIVAASAKADQHEFGVLLERVASQNVDEAIQAGL